MRLKTKPRPSDWQIVRDVPVYQLDVTKPFPFQSGIFDAVFSERMIEHIPYLAGRSTLQECFRVLKAGGMIRISTPNLHFLIDLYDHPATITLAGRLTGSFRGRQSRTAHSLSTISSVILAINLSMTSLR